MRDLSPLLNPRSVAIVGATPVETRPAGRALNYARRYGFKGPIYLINPKRDEIGSEKCYPDLASLPERPDLAIIAVPAGIVLDVVRGAGDVPAFCVYSSGFGEAGEAGQALQDALSAHVKQTGALLSGPNSQGLANFHAPLVAYFTSELGQDDMPPGNIGFVSQSGALGGIMASECRNRNLGLGYLVSTGNEANVTFSEVLAHMLRDPKIAVVAGYLEGLRDPAAFRAAAALAKEVGKPLVILKVGRDEAGRAAAATHTGALAGTHAVYEAAFRQWGVVSVDNIAELYDAVEVFAQTPRGRGGRRVAVVTNSGGIGVLCADRVGETGLTLASLTPETQSKLRDNLPSFVRPANPLDTALQFLNEPEKVMAHIRAIAEDPGVDVVLPFFGVIRRNIELFTDAIAEIGRETGKAVITGWLGGDDAAPTRMRALGLAAFREPRDAIAAINALAQFQESLASPSEHPHPPDEKIIRAAARIDALARQGTRQLGEQDAKAVLAEAGLPVTTSILAHDVSEALAAAASIGWPVVLKIESPGIPHRTEAGGVIAGITSAEQLREAHGRIIENARAFAPNAEIQGVSVHETARGVAELIVGINHDPTFGPVVLLGMGGIHAEILKDTQLRLPPLGESEARAMAEALKGYPLLARARGQPPVNFAALSDFICRLATLAEACGTPLALDVNPLIAGASGVVAADALITFSAQGEYARL